MKVEADIPAEQRGNTDAAFQIALQRHGVKYLQYVADNDCRAYETLISRLSFTDACKHGYDLVV